ncbi:unnamed protein product [Amoebophrya sp. A25]|nr:unnamed protein product [Amoebophrya sp. A25]|eukprot:GSA25T00008394001.1
MAAMLKSPVCTTREGMGQLVKYLPLLVGRNACSDKDFVVGKTKLFMKLNVQRGLFYQKNLALANHAIVLQRSYRGHRVRKLTRKTIALQTEVAAFLKLADGVYGIDVAKRLAKNMRHNLESASNSGASSADEGEAGPSSVVSSASSRSASGGDHLSAGAQKKPSTLVPSASIHLVKKTTSTSKDVVAAAQQVGYEAVETELRKHRDWCVERSEYGNDLILLPRNLFLLEEIAHKMTAEIELLCFLHTKEYLKIEDVVLLNNYLAQARGLDLGDDSATKVLEDRIHRITTQLPLFEALENVTTTSTSTATGGGCSSTSTSGSTSPTTAIDAEEVHRVIEGVRKADAKLFENSERWIRPEGMELLKKAQAKLEDLGGWPPKRKNEPEPVAEEPSVTGAKASPEKQEASAQEGDGRASPSGKDTNMSPSSSSQQGVSRKLTITGMVQSQVEELKRDLYNAKLTYDCQQLEYLLQRATAKGLKGEEILPYRQLHQKLCTSEYVVSLLTHVSRQLLQEQRNTSSSTSARTRESTSSSSSSSCSSSSGANAGSSPSLEKKKGLQQQSVQNLLEQGKRLHLPRQVIDSAAAILRDTLGPSCNNGEKRRKSVFMSAETTEAELRLAMKEFGNLYNYPGLREKKPVIDPKTGQDLFLEHGKQRLRAPLTTCVPAKHVGTVLQCFRNILGWMNDRPVPDSKRVVLAFTIVAVAKAEVEIRNEVFLQSIKQVRGNPNARSELLGWKLLHLLSQQAAPKADLIEFVVCFLKQGIELNRRNTKRLEIADIARDCFRALEQNLEEMDQKEQDLLGYSLIYNRHLQAGAGSSLPAHHEHPGEVLAKNKTAGEVCGSQSGVSSSASTVKIEVFLMDNTARKLRCKRHTTVGELGTKMAEILRMSPENSVGFGFFQLVEDVIETHRIIPDNVALGDLVDKWNAMHRKTNRQSRLLWKRQYLLKTENVVCNDQSFASLTFRQAYFEYMRYPVGPGSTQYDALPLFHHVACSLLLLEHVFFRDYIEAGNLVPILEKLLPTVLMVMIAERHGPIPEEKRGTIVRQMEEVSIVNSRSGSSRSTRLTQLRGNHLIVPPLVNDPSFIGFHVVHSKNIDAFRELYGGSSSSASTTSTSSDQQLHDQKDGATSTILSRTDTCGASPSDVEGDASTTSGRSSVDATSSLGSNSSSLSSCRNGSASISLGSNPSMASPITGTSSASSSSRARSWAETTNALCRQAVNTSQSNAQTSAILALGNQVVASTAGTDATATAASSSTSSKSSSSWRTGSAPFILGDCANVPSLRDFSEAILDLWDREYRFLQEDTALQKMSRALNGMQQLRYYGSYFYSIQELETEAIYEKDPNLQTDVPIRELSPHPSRQYWICIDLEGVTLLGKEQTSQNLSFVKRFLYFTGAQSCVTKWGAKDSVILLQLREPNLHYCSVFSCKMALDIAYCMFRLSKTRNCGSTAAASN